MMRKRLQPIALLLGLALGPAVSAQDEVTVYVSLDEEHSSKILKLFETETGVKVRYNPDTEDNKTVGLVNKIIAEGGKPLADVYWNNECGQTERLRAMGLLEPYVSPNAAAIPAKFKDPEGYWTGFAARARILIYNTTKIAPGDLPKRLEELAEPRFASRCAMAKPLTGTTFTHAGVLYAAWGAEKTNAWFDALQKNGMRFERGNAQVAQIVAEGDFPFGLTDTDDIRVRQLDGRPVDQVLLDQGAGEMGTLVIPNSVMILKGAPHPDAARRLVDFLLTPRVEQLLADSPSVQIPLHPGVPAPPAVLDIAKIRSQDVDWREVGAMIEKHKLELEQRFVGGGAPTESKGAVPAIVFAGAALALAVGFAFLALRSRKTAPSAAKR